MNAVRIYRSALYDRAAHLGRLLCAPLPLPKGKTAALESVRIERYLAPTAVSSSAMTALNYHC